MDDDFIDDTEIHDYYGGDRRKTKYTGFFMNKVRHTALLPKCQRMRNGSTSLSFPLASSRAG